MEPEASTHERIAFGQIVSDSLETYFGDVFGYIAIAAGAVLPVALCSGALWALGDFARTAADGWSNPSRDLVAVLPYAVGTFLLSMLAYPLMQGALIHATEQKHRGRRISIRQSYLCAVRHGGRLIGAWLITGLLIAAMMASLICFPFALFGGDSWLFILTAVLAIGLPFGLYFFIKWLLVLQTVMLEGSGVIESLGRSGALVTGNWWRSLGVWVVLSVAPAFVIGIPVSILLALWDNPNGFVARVVQDMLPALLVVPLSAIAQTLLFFDLRTRRDQHVSQIVGGAAEIPSIPKVELPAQTPSVKARQPRKLNLKPALIAIAVPVVLAAVITPTILYFHNRADAGDIQVFVKSLSTGKKVEIGHGNLKTLDCTDFAFLVEFNGSIQAGEQENTIEITGSDEFWSNGVATVQVYAEEGSEEEFLAPVQYDFHLPEESPSNALGIGVDILDEHHVLVSPEAGEFPSGSQLVLNLDFGGGSGWCARMFTR